MGYEKIDSEDIGMMRTFCDAFGLDINDIDVYVDTNINDRPLERLENGDTWMVGR